MYISESRLTGNTDGGGKIIEPGSKTICQAMATIVTQGADGQVEREEACREPTTPVDGGPEVLSDVAAHECFGVAMCRDGTPDRILERVHAVNPQVVRVRQLLRRSQQ